MHEVYYKHIYDLLKLRQMRFKLEFWRRKVTRDYKVAGSSHTRKEMCGVLEYGLLVI